MIADLPPGIELILGAALVPFLRGRLRGAWLLLMPILALAHVWSLPAGDAGRIAFLGQELILVRADSWSLLFGTIFCVAALLTAIYALEVEDWVQHAAGMIYAGSAIAAVFAGDYLTLFVFWELTAASSVFLIWSSRNQRAYRAGLRYLIVHLASGMLLLVGALVHANATGSLAFGKLGLDAPGAWLIFLAFGVKCAFPLLHNWLQDAYPEATVAGTVYLSAFTTKLAVYALARGFPGTEMLIWIGAAMAVFPIVYAMIENNLRRTLAYGMISQLGIMVTGVGIGSELALNGTAAHASASVLYTSLLFMAAGAILHRAGTIDANALGGLRKSMPWTAALCVIGALSIAGAPFLIGFVSKSMVLSAGGEAKLGLPWLMLLLASVGIAVANAVKVPFAAFFGHDSGIRCKEAPASMLTAMGLTAALCVGIGVYPAPLYALLPYPVDYVPYTGEHVLTQLQLLLFSALAFSVLMRTGIYPPELRSTNLDFDWLWRGLGARFLRGATVWWDGWAALARAGFRACLAQLMSWIYRHHGPEGALARTWPTGAMALGATVLLLVYLLLYYL